MGKTFEEEKKYLERTIVQFKEIEKDLEQKFAEAPAKFDNPIVRDCMLDTYELKLIRMRKTELKPYFARINFQNDEEENEEECYIGKVGVFDDNQKPIIVDWRAPISNLYYDSNVGYASYESPDGIINGNLLVKRQYVIEDKILKSFQDVDTVSNDDILTPYLGTSVDNRLKNIVSTIQAEQNDIIREKISKNIIIQGVAGSGKTTVALHRIAYLVYNNINTINPNQYIVIGPNKFFVNYISGVLPDLDVANVKQTTYDDIARDLLKEDFILLTDEKKLITSITDPSKMKFEKLKLSMDFKKALDKFLNEYNEELKPQDNLIIKGYNIFPKEVMKKIYDSVNEQDLKYEILNRKIDKVISLISNKIKDNKEQIKSHLREEEYKKINNGSNVTNESKIINNIYKQLNTGCTEALRKMFSKSKPKIINLYIKYIQSLDKYFDTNDLDTESLIKNLKKKKIEFEDLGSLLYLYYRIYGSGTYDRFRHAVIDESQDFGELNFYALKKIMSSTTFSIFGDLAQSIYEYRGTKNWKEIIQKVFDGDCELKYLSKSYRTTTEIMLSANNITKHLNLITATPVIRHGKEVVYTKTKNRIEEIDNILKNYKQKEYSSIAIITKTEEESTLINEQLNQLGYNAKNITSKDLLYDGGLCTITSYLAKGLEFDAVIISNAEEKEYNSSKAIDMKLLYVAMTRPLHELHILYEENITKPLQNLK